MKTATKDPQRLVKAAKRRLNAKIEKQRKERQAAKKRAQFQSILLVVFWIIVALIGFVLAIRKVL